ncbi:MAG: LPS-assembly protein LptD [Steroidobacteraceae bacterium]
MPHRFHHHRCGRTALILILAVPGLVDAQALICPAGSGTATTRPGSSAAKPNIAALPIELLADGSSIDLTGWSTLSGHVEARQGERVVSTDALRFNVQTGEIIASGKFNLEDSTLFLSGNNANLDSTGGARVEQASFLLKSNAGRGAAQSIQISPQGNLMLDTVSYTTCPVAAPAWELKLSNLDINQETHTGTGRNVRLEFKGVPIFYTPWISFPVGNQRKSGFLFPSFGGSSRGGNSLIIPWYWNIASNYDDTITPSYDTSRGFKLDNEFRYRGESSRASLITGFLPKDQRTDEWRGAASLNYRHDLNQQLRFDVSGSAVRDNSWYEDFGGGSDITSQVYLTRAIAFTAQTQRWYGELRLQNLQTLDDDIVREDRPYTELPRLSISGQETLPGGFDFKLDSELGYFTRGLTDTTTQTESVTGARLYLNPTLSLPLRAPGMYLTPSAGWHYTRYQLSHTTNDAARSPSLSAPLYSLDTGLILERLNGSHQQRLYTLEPRLLYVYVPYRDQSDLPTAFDTDLPDFGLARLFRTNRFIGPDRLGDTNQLSAGVTTRLLSATDGTQYLSGTLGQTYYFSTPCITSLTQTSCSNGVAQQQSSDLIGELALAAYRNFSVNLGVQWNPTTSRSERGDVFIQYRTDNSHIVNLGYRYDRAEVEQWESSFAWPLSSAWSGYGRVVYSRLDKKFLDHFAGLEYRSCCFNIRAVVGRAITTRSGEYDTQYKIQLELKGLSSVGTADTFLEGAITGYSARTPSN